MDRKTQLLTANRRYYQNRRNRLVQQLGGVCVHCFRDGIENRVDLEFDHKNADRKWCMRKLGPLQRLIRIEQEAAEDRIQLLCGHHNGLKRNTVEDDELAAELRGDNHTQESETEMARKKTETPAVDELFAEPTPAEVTTKKPRKARYGQAYTSLLECMSAPNGEPTAKLFTIAVNVQAQEVCVMATSRAMALNAACQLVFGEPRKTTDKDKCELMRQQFVAQAANGTKA